MVVVHKLNPVLWHTPIIPALGSQGRKIVIFVLSDIVRCIEKKKIVAVKVYSLFIQSFLAFNQS